jgi:hypothetical protein
MMAKRVARNTSPLHLEFAFYRAVQWSPAWWNPAGPAWVVSRAWLADALDVAVCGLVLVAGLAFSTQPENLKSARFQTVSNLEPEM